MPIFSIPGLEEPLDLRTLILDLNGTLTIDGIVIDGVKERLDVLRGQLRLVLFTGDTQGNAQRIAQELGLEVRITPNAQAKADEARTLDPQRCATIGNGRIDLELFKTVRLRIGVILKEGAYTKTLNESDMQFTSILDALEVFQQPKRLNATLRQ